MAAPASANAPARAIADPRGRGDLVAERLAGLDPRGRGRRPEDGEPGRGQGIGHACRQRRLRADDDQLRRLAPGDGQDGRRIERVDAGHAAHPRLQPDRGAPRRHDDLVDPRFPRQLPGQCVLAPATPHDQDPGRHHQPSAAVHAGKPGRWRIGRQARSIVWVRSGPTETSTIGTPAWASIADT